MDIFEHVRERSVYDHVNLEIQSLWRTKDLVNCASSPEAADKISAYISAREEELFQSSLLDHFREFKQHFEEYRLDPSRVGISSTEIDSLLEYVDYLILKKKERGR